MTYDEWLVHVEDVGHQARDGALTAKEVFDLVMGWAEEVTRDEEFLEGE